jgi:hypothetical protein
MYICGLSYYGCARLEVTTNNANTLLITAVLLNNVNTLSDICLVMKLLSDECYVTSGQQIVRESHVGTGCYKARETVRLLRLDF